MSGRAGQGRAARRREMFVFSHPSENSGSSALPPPDPRIGASAFGARAVLRDAPGSARHEVGGRTLASELPSMLGAKRWGGPKRNGSPLVRSVQAGMDCCRAARADNPPSRPTPGASRKLIVRDAHSAPAAGGREYQLSIISHRTGCFVIHHATRGAAGARTGWRPERQATSSRNTLQQESAP